MRRALLQDLAGTPRGLWITCTGRSMEPTVRLGDRVLVRACRRIRAGDVVLFQGARSLVLHRVVLAVPLSPWFLHIGDAGSGDGPGIARCDAIIGRADLPRRAPSVAQYRAGMHRLLRAAGRRLNA